MTLGRSADPGSAFGWIIGLLLVVLVFVYLRYTKSGYEISVVGESQATARYAGINVKRVMIVTMVLSGAISGIAGMLQVTGTDFTLSTGVASGVGFTAIIVAWLGQLNPFVILVFTAFFSILEKGSGVIQTAFGLSSYAADNLFPSIHCLVSWFCFQGIRGRQEIPKWYQYLSCVIAVCVFLSTLMTKQHVVWDVAGGVILAQICFTVSGKTQWYRIYQRFCERIQSCIFHLTGGARHER